MPCTAGLTVPVPALPLLPAVPRLNHCVLSPVHHRSIVLHVFMWQCKNEMKVLPVCRRNKMEELEMVTSESQRMRKMPSACTCQREGDELSQIVTATIAAAATVVAAATCARDRQACSLLLQGCIATHAQLHPPAAAAGGGQQASEVAELKLHWSMVCFLKNHTARCRL